MKKRITSILLCLCMVLSVFSGMTVIQASASAATPIEGMTFGYAYDVQRNPDLFPPFLQSFRL